MSLENLRNSGRLSLFFLVAAICGFDLVILLMRMKYTGNFHFIFLIWNLILAFIPYVAALGLHAREDRGNPIVSGLLLLVWIVFLPNAPYLITDLIHLSIHDGMGVWFDIIILMSFASTGLILGLLSLYDVHRWLFRHFKKWIGWVAVVAACYGSGLGIYVGRFLRWNSWDLATRPGALLQEGGTHFATSSQLELQIGFMIIMGTFMLLFYVVGWHFLRHFAIRERLQDKRDREAYWSVTF